MKRSRSGEGRPLSSLPEAPSNSAGEDGNAQQPSATDAPNIMCANIIKRHHEVIRAAVTARRRQRQGNLNEDPHATVPSSACSSSVPPVDERDWGAWMEATSDGEALQQYADAMHRLATEYWDAKEGSSNSQQEMGEGESGSEKKERYDDRIKYVLLRMQDYFFGAEHAALPAAHQKFGVPSIVSGLVKARRRDFFQQHGRQMDTEAAAALPAGVLKEMLEKTGEASTVARIGKLLLQQQHPALLGLKVLDVGSCYAPFQGKCLKAAALLPTSSLHVPPAPAIDVPLDLVSVDLQPARNTPTLKCDWLQVPIALEPEESSSSCIETSSGNEVKKIYQGRFDAVIFSLLLSYLPTAQMRYLACIQAHRALRDDGLLIMVNTRTQGSRQSKWEAKWIEGIEKIGFQRVHKDILHNLVGMSFRRIGGWCGGERRKSHEEDAAWAKELLSSPFAQCLSVTADAEAI